MSPIPARFRADPEAFPPSRGDSENITPLRSTRQTEPPVSPLTARTGVRASHPEPRSTVFPRAHARVGRARRLPLRGPTPPSPPRAAPAPPAFPVHTGPPLTRLTKHTPERTHRNDKKRSSPSSWVDSPMGGLSEFSPLPNLGNSPIVPCQSPFDTKQDHFVESQERPEKFPGNSCHPLVSDT